MKKPTDEFVPEFHKAFDLPRPKILAAPDADLLRLRWRLITEEYKEVVEEFEKLRAAGNFAEWHASMLRLAKELADLRYVAEGAAVSFGIDHEAVYREVHRSNMSKLQANGTPLLREDGKVLKSDGYTPPDIEGVLGAIIDAEAEVD